MILDRISSWCQKYLAEDHVSDSENSENILHLELAADDKSEKHVQEGWNLISENRKLVYSENGEALFALQNEETISETIISIYKNCYSSIRIGMQFGTLLALQHHCIGLHGVTLLCGNRIIVLSAPSGTGKTTLARLLEEYADAIIINGDFAMLSAGESGVFFEPTPFCGSSGRCLNHRVQIDQVVFLEQAKNNKWQSLTGRPAMTRFMSNTFVPTWDKVLQQTIQSNVLKIVSIIPTYLFGFAPNPKAAEDFMKHIH